MCVPSMLFKAQPPGLGITTLWSNNYSFSPGNGQCDSDGRVETNH